MKRRSGTEQARETRGEGERGGGGGGGGGGTKRRRRRRRNEEEEEEGGGGGEGGGRDLQLTVVGEELEVFLSQVGSEPHMDPVVRVVAAQCPHNRTAGSTGVTEFRLLCLAEGDLTWL
eukprot:527499-Hanusia_phi.AAC.2